ncbi:MAG: hypothetical protein O2856_06330 [Planctomycetota bacterium]|nr:hypothetical protein [Planctomycetota bacterium]
MVHRVCDRSTAPITLAMIAAITAAALPLCMLLAVKVNALLRRFMGKFVTPALRFLNRPIALGHIAVFTAFFRAKVAGTDKAQTSRQG